jgi:hypothetical protein
VCQICTPQLLTVLNIQADKKDDNSKNGSNSTTDDIDDVSNISDTDNNQTDDHHDTKSRTQSKTDSKTEPNAEPKGKEAPSDKVSKHAACICTAVVCTMFYSTSKRMYIASCIVCIQALYSVLLCVC